MNTPTNEGMGQLDIDILTNMDTNKDMGQLEVKKYKEYQAINSI